MRLSQLLPHNSPQTQRGFDRSKEIFVRFLSGKSYLLLTTNSETLHHSHPPPNEGEGSKLVTKFCPEFTVILFSKVPEFVRGREFSNDSNQLRNGSYQLQYGNTREIFDTLFYTVASAPYNQPIVLHTYRAKENELGALFQLIKASTSAVYCTPYKLIYR